MATATKKQQQQASGTQAQQQPQTESELLERILSLPITQRVKAIDDALTRRIDKVRELLPDMMKGQAERLVRRAMLTFTKSDKLQKCTPQSFIKCVLEAAEVGLAIDGRLAHAVPYGQEATFICDYKGVIAVAKRCGLIQDAWARLVYSNDKFELHESDGKQHYDHKPVLTDDRGSLVGAFAVATHKDGWHRVEWMTKGDLLKIQSRSKAGSSGPWATDPGEMRKKSVLKRLLKTFSDDPGMIRLFELDKDLDDIHDTATTGPPRKASSLDDLIAGDQDKPAAPQEPPANSWQDEFTIALGVTQSREDAEKVVIQWDAQQKNDADLKWMEERLNERWPK